MRHFYTALVYLLPPSFRRRHGRELRQVAMTARQLGTASSIGLVADVLRTVVAEWLSVVAATLHLPRRTGGLLRDLRYGARVLVKNPGLTLAAVLTMALGIGANTAMFSLAHATLLRPVQVAAPDRLASWSWTSAYPDYLRYTERTDLFSGVLAWSGGSRVSIAVDGAPELATALFVSGNAFDVLGVPPAAGRVMRASDDVLNAPVVAVLSYEFWRARFGGAADVVGRPIRVNGQDVTIAGVAQEGFRGLALESAPAIYLPLTGAGRIRGGFFAQPQLFVTRNWVWLNVVGRLREGVTIDQASAAIDTLYRGLDPPEPGAEYAPLRLTPLTTRALGEDDAPAIERFVLLLVAVVGATLLLGCANLANLLLAKAAGRRHEVALRLALGAARGQVVRQLVVESVMLSALGGVAGLLVAAGAMRVLSTYQLPGGVPIDSLGLALDGLALAVSAALALATGLLFGAAPAWHAARTDLLASLRDDSRSVVHTARIRTVLVAAQVMVSVTLLAGTGLFARSLAHAIAIPPGFDTTGVATASVNAGLVRYSDAQARTYYRDALDRVRTLPGVRAAAWTALIPSNGLMINQVDVEGFASGDGRPPTFSVGQVGPEYFRAAGTRVLEGRAFLSTDGPGAEPVAIVSRTAAEKYLPGRSPLGAHIRPSGATVWRTIVGVVEDVTVRHLGEAPMPAVYYPFDQPAGGLARAVDSAHLMVRVSGDAREVLPALATELRAVDPLVPVYAVVPFAEHVRELTMPQQMGATLLAFFSVLAVSLACVGIYGVSSYVAQLRTREIGIRMALGADARDVRRTVLAYGAAPVGVGMVAGLGLALWAARFVQAFLYDVSPADPAAFAGAAVLLALVALAASWLPARRAARLDPVAALRVR